MASLDICICTFNRSSYLKRCLDALISQVPFSNVKILIIDNASTDDTANLIRQYTHHTFIRTYKELQSGLSHARNRGWKESDADWILYIDDDCHPRPGFIKNALDIIETQPSESAIGGPIYPLYENQPPDWLPIGFGQFTMPFDQYTVISNGYIRGGCMMIKRNILSSQGGFDPELGVQDKKLRYGEELELQDRMRKANNAISYAPSLAIDHFVRIEKIKTSWLLHSEFAKRRDKMKFSPLPFLPLTVKLGITSIKTLVVLPAFFIRSLVDKKYSGQKASLDALIPLMYRSGEWWGVISRKKKSG